MYYIEMDYSEGIEISKVDHELKTIEIFKFKYLEDVVNFLKVNKITRISTPFTSPYIYMIVNRGIEVKIDSPLRHTLYYFRMSEGSCVERIRYEVSHYFKNLLSYTLLEA